MMYEYAYVIDGNKIGQIERLAEPLPVDHPKVKAGILVPVETPQLEPGMVREGAATVTVENGKAVRRYADRPMTADEIAKRKADKIDKIKIVAGDRIAAKMPTYKQLNWLAQGLRNVITLGPDATKWPKKARDDLAETLAAFSEIEAVRAKSDAKEAEVAALTDAAAVTTYPTADGWE